MADRDEPDFLQETEHGLRMSKAGKERLSDVVTTTEGDVYAFTGRGVESIVPAAAMARLSRSPNDLRVTVLKEFSNIKDTQALLRRVITEYGDDSVQQLAGNHFVFENVSNLATKAIEWGRLAAYLEQSTRYIEYDTLDEHGKFKYFTPTALPKKLAAEYNAALDSIFERYSHVVKTLKDYLAEHSTTPENERTGAWKAAIRAQACDAARPMLPVATKSTVGVFADGQATEMMIMRLRASTNNEFTALGNSLLQEMRKVNPVFLERADKPERGGAYSAYLRNTAQAVENLTRNILTAAQPAPSVTPVTLYDVHPKNELDILPDIAYDHSQLSRKQIAAALKTADQKTKQQLFNTYFGERLNRRHRPGRALENITYAFDLVCDYGCFRDLQRHRIVDDLRWQKLTPYLGYEVPELVTKAGLAAQFNQAFELSKTLYETLHAAGLNEDSQYATLLGHNVRWRVRMNAREAFHLLELRTTPQGHPGYRRLCKQMYDEIAKVHPNLARHMLFINKDEDPELTRLAAERAKELKLQQLDAAEGQSK